MMMVIVVSIPLGTWYSLLLIWVLEVVRWLG